MPEINGVNLPFIPIGGTDALNRTIKPIETKATSVKFDDLLSQELLKFSGHAQNRMVSREINLNDVEMLRLDEAVEKAKSKGAQESLVMLDDKLFIVAVNNKTVITMFDKNQMDTDVIMNIDSAVFA